MTLWICRLGIAVNLLLFVAGMLLFASASHSYVSNGHGAPSSPFFGVMVFAALNIAAIHKRTTSDNVRVPILIVNSFLLIASVILSAFWFWHPNGHRIADWFIHLCLLAAVVSTATLAGIAATQLNQRTHTHS